MKNTLLHTLVSFCTGKPALFSLATFGLFALPFVASANDGITLESIFGVGMGAVLGPVTVLAWLSFKIASFLLGISGIVFNWTIAILVFEFGTYFGNSSGLLLGWSILRDFANIGLLFGFVFMGISTILDLHSYPWKKSLPMLVIFAVLLNFSLFVTEAVIDSTNAVSTILFEQSFEPAGCQQETWLDCVINTGVAGAVLTNANIATAYNGGTAIDQLVAGVAAQFTAPVENTMKFIALAILVSVAATVFFAAAGLFLSRGIMLAFLMVTSPIGFAGMAVPFLHGLAEKWWHELLHQSFFAPVFLLLLLVGLKITEGLAAISGTSTIGSVFDSRNVVDTGALLVFFLVIGFFMASLIIAKQFGIKAADFFVNSAGSFVYGSMARGNALVLGKSAEILNNRIQRSRTLSKNGVARGLSSLVLKPMQKNSMDMRGIPLVSNVLSGGGIPTGIAEHASYKDQKHIIDDAIAQKGKKKRKKEFDAEVRVIEIEKRAHDDDGRNVSTAMTDEDRKFLNEMSEAELIELHGIQDGVGSIAANLSPDKFESLMKNKDLDESTKSELKKNREEYFGTNNGLKLISEMKPEVVVKIPPSILAKPATLRVLNARQFGRMNPDDFGTRELAAIGTHLKNEMNARTTVGTEFRTLMNANPTVKNKWTAHVT